MQPKVKLKLKTLYAIWLELLDNTLFNGCIRCERMLTYILFVLILFGPMRSTSTPKSVLPYLHSMLNTLK